MKKAKEYLFEKHFHVTKGVKLPDYLLNESVDNPYHYQGGLILSPNADKAVEIAYAEGQLDILKRFPVKLTDKEREFFEKKYRNITE